MLLTKELAGEPETTYNTTCEHYCRTAIRMPMFEKVEHSCDCGMDMFYCGKDCAFASDGAVNSLFGGKKARKG